MASPYEILGVEPTATDQEIKRAYRSLQLQFHPDRNGTPEAAEKIRLINEAYAVLTDKEKRRQFVRAPPPWSLHRPPTSFRCSLDTTSLKQLFSIILARFTSSSSSSSASPRPFSCT